MGDFQWKEDLKALQTLAEHYDHQLRSVGVELADLSEDLSNLLDVVVQIQQKTSLENVNMDSLKCYFADLQKQQLQDELKLSNLQREIEEQERQIATETIECEILERFTKKNNHCLMSESEMQRQKIILETKSKALLDRQNSIKIPQGVHIDEMLKNLETLQQLQKPKPK